MSLVGKDSGHVAHSDHVLKDLGEFCVPCLQRRPPHVREPPFSTSPVLLQKNHSGSWFLLGHERARRASCPGCGFLPQASLLFPVLNVPEAREVVPRVSSEQRARQQAGTITVRRSGFPFLFSQSRAWLTPGDGVSSCHHRDVARGVKRPRFYVWLSLPSASLVLSLGLPSHMCEVRGLGSGNSEVLCLFNVL